VVRTNAWFAIAGILGLILFSLHGCGRDHPVRPIAGAPGANGIRWISPAPEDSILSDTLRIEIAVAGRVDDPVVILVNGSPVDRRIAPPWRFAYLPSGDGSRRIRLAAGTETGPKEERVIRWGPDAPPEVRMAGIPPGGGVERAAAESLIAVAFDPEEGPLRGRAITWTSDRQGIVGYGDRLPTDALVPGVHRIRLRATDRWGNSAIREAGIETFDYSAGADAGEVVDDLRHAMLAGDSAAYMDRIDPDFRFYPCPAERDASPDLPAYWDRAGEESFAGRLTAIRAIRWKIRPFPPSNISGEEWVKIEIEDLDLGYSGESADTYHVSNGRGRLFFVRKAAGHLWKLRQWQDLGANDGSSYARLRSLVMKALS
jgi:hypothetical protein